MMQAGDTVTQVIDGQPQEFVLTLLPGREDEGLALKNKETGRFLYTVEWFDEFEQLLN